MSFKTFIFVLYILNQSVSSQDSAEERRFIDNDPELTTIPPDIVECYTNMELWDRYKRLPSNIESLVALIRKAELHPAVKNWTPGIRFSIFKEIFLDFLEFNATF